MFYQVHISLASAQLAALLDDLLKAQGYRGSAADYYLYASSDGRQWLVFYDQRAAHFVLDWLEKHEGGLQG